MSTLYQRAAAVSLSLALGAGGAFALASSAVAETTPTPSASASPTPARAPGTPKEATPTEFRKVDGTPNSRPQYERLSESDTKLTSFGSLYTKAGKPMAQQVVAVYYYTDGKRGRMLGSGTTNESGQFRFTADLPRGWNAIEGFNVQLAFDDPNGEEDGVLYDSVSLVMKPEVSDPDPTPTPTPTRTPTKSPTTSPTTSPTKGTGSGGLANTGN